jgi:hypothetical protein
MLEDRQSQDRSTRPPRCDLGYEVHGDGARNELDAPFCQMRHGTFLSRVVCCLLFDEGSRPGKAVDCMGQGC